ncbi:MAG: STM4013/SEN3800 family hydrolase [Fibrella sp.]|nr:STM4013/SEN3800 family hydrolase [Armatimonadota bacterium]
MLDAAAFLGTGDIVFVTFDTLRYDVAVAEWKAGRTPNLRALLPEDGWEERHTPGNFTYAAHQAFFAGFLPTPAVPGKHPRLFAARFAGSETTAPETAVFDAPDIVSGLRTRGYHSVCIGGVGFFNRKTPLGSVLPSLFDEAHWNESFGVTAPNSTENQLQCAAAVLENIRQPVFLFVNISALHQPNWFYIRGRVREKGDDRESHAAALRYVDRQLPILRDALRKRGCSLCVFCSDHGTTYGEDGYTGHRLAHPHVWSVPYAEFFLQP